MSIAVFAPSSLNSYLFLSPFIIFFRYKVMSKERQLNPFGEDCISSETCLDQLNKAPAERTIIGMNKKDKIVVSDDRVLFLKHKRDGIMNEWVEVFTKDVKALEINTPGQCKLFQ